jgi:GTP cyclohydrolase II
MPTQWGEFSARAITDAVGTHLLLSYGDICSTSRVLVRMHSSCCFGDVFNGISCDCRAQLDKALEAITAEGCGLFFYLNQEGRGIGLSSKIEAIRTEQHESVDTVEAFSRLHYPLDSRSYTVVSDTLKLLGITKIRLMTNNPSKINALMREGLDVVREPVITPPTAHSINYLKAKIEKMGHLWDGTLESPELKLPKKSKAFTT